MIQGRKIGPSQLEQIRQLLVEHPGWSRKRLSRQLAALWQWRNPVGQLKDMAAASLLRKLDHRGWISLPPRRRSVPPSRMRLRAAVAPELPTLSAPIVGPLTALLPLAINEVSTPFWAGERALFARLLQQYHYLSYRSWVGQNLQYLARDAQSRPVACVLFGAAAWQCADRDRYIGWDAPTRQQHLHLLANNSRFMILPWVEVPQLASHLWSQLAGRLSGDWQAKYGHPIHLLETFVQSDRFAGTAYQSANWVHVGQTKGRSRQDRPDGWHYQLPVKDIYLFALHPRFRELLQGKANTPTDRLQTPSSVHDDNLHPPTSKPPPTGRSPQGQARGSTPSRRVD